jgi:hypothetical protein
MTATEELRHLHEGAYGEQPPGETDIAEAPGGTRTLARAREVLEAVLTRAQAGGDWPTTPEWQELLPPWFTAACVDDSEVRDCVLDKWSLRAWVYWFQPDLRQWRWWDVDVSHDRLRITLLVLRRPYRRAALDWLLEVAASG